MKISNILTIIITLALVGLLAYRIYKLKTSPLNPKTWFKRK